MDKYWIWFSRICAIGARKQNQLLDKYKTPQKIWELTKEQLEKNEFLTKEDVNNILEEKYRKNLNNYIKYMQKNSIFLLTIQDEEYPAKLKKIYDPPVVLFVKGNKQILNMKSIAIIGSRLCSNYGRKVSEKFAYELAKNNIIIISGLAKGIDTQAHKGTLNIKGSTIAVVRMWIR